MIVMYFFVCYPYYPTFRFFDVNSSHIKWDDRDSTVLTKQLKESYFVAYSQAFKICGARNFE